MKCLDTSVIIDLLRNKKEAVEKVKSIGEDAILTTRINIFEVLFGIFVKRGKDSQKFSEGITSLMSKVKILELDEVSCIQSAKIKSNLVLHRKEIEDADCFIAGIMLANGCDTIITKNKDHFNRIKEIKVEGY